MGSCEFSQGSIAMDVVRQEYAGSTQARKDRLPFEEEVPRGMEAVVEKDVDVAKLHEQPP